MPQTYFPRTGYGMIWVEDGVATQTFNANPALFTKLNAWTDNGLSAGPVTPDVANDQLVITSKGVYRLQVSITGYWTNNRDLRFYFYVQGVKQKGGGHIYGANIAQMNSCSFHWIVACNAGDTIDVRGAGDTGSEVFTMHDAVLSATILA